MLVFSCRYNNWLWTAFMHHGAKGLGAGQDDADMDDAVCTDAALRGPFAAARMPLQLVCGTPRPCFASLFLLPTPGPCLGLLRRRLGHRCIHALEAATHARPLDSFLALRESLLGASCSLRHGLLLGSDYYLLLAGLIQLVISASAALGT
jgi:hypothetical protein